MFHNFQIYGSRCTNGNQTEVQSPCYKSSPKSAGYLTNAGRNGAPKGTIGCQNGNCVKAGAWITKSRFTVFPGFDFDEISMKYIR